MNFKTDEETLENCLKALDGAELNYLLNQVLTEMRGRESEQIKKDVLTHSKSLRLEIPVEQYQE